MIAKKHIYLKNKNTNMFVMRILRKSALYTPTKECAREFKWYNWFFYRMLIKIMSGDIVRRSSYIEIEGG